MMITMKYDASKTLEAYNLRNTEPRVFVLEVLAQMKRPANHKEIYERIQKKNRAINLVTVYRVLEKFQDLGIVHWHPSTGGVKLCSLDTRGHHGFLSCEKCGTVEEFVDTKLCKEENRIAKKAGFSPRHHMSEIVGICAMCQ